MCEATNTLELHILNKQIQNLTVKCSALKEVIGRKEKELSREIKKKRNASTKRSTAKQAADFILTGGNSDTDQDKHSEEQTDHLDYLRKSFEKKASELIENRASRKILAMRIKKQEDIVKENDALPSIKEYNEEEDAKASAMSREERAPYLCY